MHNIIITCITTLYSLSRLKRQTVDNSNIYTDPQPMTRHKDISRSPSAASTTSISHATTSRVVHATPTRVLSVPQLLPSSIQHHPMIPRPLPSSIPCHPNESYISSMSTGISTSVISNEHLQDVQYTPVIGQ